MTEEKENCNFQQNYNVFGLDDKPCCYLYHKYCDEIDSCYFKRCKRLEQENKELKKLIRGTKDYAEVCSVCKDEVTIYPNISGRTDYTQNEVECRTLTQITTRKNNLEQENEKLLDARNHFMAENLKYFNALEEIREIVTSAFAKQRPYKEDFAEIETKINEVLGDEKVSD